jgi:hypothetical protein
LAAITTSLSYLPKRAIAPALKTRPIAIAIALILHLFTVVPYFSESVGGAMAEPSAIAPFSRCLT